MFEEEKGGSSGEKDVEKERNRRGAVRGCGEDPVMRGHQSRQWDSARDWDGKPWKTLGRRMT